MTIKLITVNDVKISLSPGEHVFGRHKILYADDKRVSREHGQLQVNTETIVLKSLHKNPCYFKKNGSTECETLSQDNSVTLRNGDKFGLIPEMDKLWYEVMYLPDTEDKETENLEEENYEKVQNSIPQEENAEINNETITNNDNITENNDTTLCNNTTENQQAHTNGDKSPSILNQDETSSSTITECQNENESRENNSSPQIKRSHSDESGSDVDIKKAKIEEQLDDIKQSTSDEASTSNDGVDRKPPNPQNPLRERCMYGANCYRKNPNHMAQFSHPCDADWGAGARGLCPYGAACAKRDPRHWRDHDHPPGAAPPAPRAPHAPGQPRVLEKAEILPEMEQNDDDVTQCDNPPSKKRLNQCEYRADEGSFNIFEPNSQYLDQYKDYEARDTTQTYGNAEENIKKLELANDAFGRFVGSKIVERHGNVFIINAHTVNFYDDHFQVTDSEGDSADYDYEF